MHLAQDTRAQFDSDAGNTFQQVLMEYQQAISEPSDPVRIIQMFNLIRTANRLPPGDYAEFGTHLGFTLKAIHKFMDPECMLYSFDTFEGFDWRDVLVEHHKGYPQWKAGGFSPTSVEHVAHYLGNPINVRFIKGRIPESYPIEKEHQWRFVHLDMDLYQPTLAALKLVWESMVPGGIILVHDYGDSGFATDEAVDEFCESRDVFPVELADHWGSAVIRRPT